MKRFIEKAKELKCEYRENEPMNRHTSFKIGGNSRLMIFPNKAEDIAEFIKLANENKERLITIGNGSNLLVSDSGIDAVVIVLSGKFSEVKLVDENTIFALAGASLTKVCRFALENSLTGLEFAYGIPGSCGGGVFMNAGAFGGEMKDVVLKCDIVDQNAVMTQLENEEMKFSYRHSAFYNNNAVITGVYFKLKKGNYEEIKKQMDCLLQKRKDKQPLEFPSAGSTFKRPVGCFAGSLIEECGLKGKSIGGAQISEKHAGFVINKGNATCEDVVELCKFCHDTVLEKKGVELEMEIRVTK